MHQPETQDKIAMLQLQIHNLEEEIKSLHEEIELLQTQRDNKAAYSETVDERLKAEQEANFQLRGVLADISNHLKLSKPPWPAEVAKRVKRMVEDKEEIETMWEQLTKTLGAHGPESDPLTGKDTNEDIHLRAMAIAVTLKP